METTTLDRAYLEYSALTQARTQREVMGRDLAWLVWFSYHRKNGGDLTSAQVAREYLISYMGQAQFHMRCLRENVPNIIE